MSNRTASHHASHAVHEVESGAEDAVNHGRQILDNVKDKAAHVTARIKTGVKNTEQSIQEHPWAAVGIAAAAGVGVGLLIGLFSRRTRD